MAYARGDRTVSIVFLRCDQQFQVRRKHSRLLGTQNTRQALWMLCRKLALRNDVKRYLTLSIPTIAIFHNHLVPILYSKVPPWFSSSQSSACWHHPWPQAPSLDLVLFYTWTRDWDVLLPWSKSCRFKRRHTQHTSTWNRKLYSSCSINIKMIYHFIGRFTLLVRPTHSALAYTYQLVRPRGQLSFLLSQLSILPLGTSSCSPQARQVRHRPT